MAGYSVLDALTKNWWILLVRGILAVLFGLLAFVLPGITLVALMLLFGVYVFADGLTALWVGATCRRWLLVLLGLVGIGVGVYTFIAPQNTALALLYLIAVWAMVRGILEVIVAMQLRREGVGEWTLILGGIVSVVLGLALFASPQAGALAMIWLIGTCALVFGALTMVLAFRVRGLARGLEGPGEGA